MPFNQELAAVEARIAAACRAAGRARSSVQLLAVSKTRPAESIAALAESGQASFGENYVQEALPKIAALEAMPLEWHHIGLIQSNKTRDIAGHFSWAHGVDQLKLAQRLSQQRPEHLPPLNICVQVNTSGEASKSGCLPVEAAALCQQLQALPRLRLRGLMCLPAPVEDGRDSGGEFRQLRRLFESLVDSGIALDTLSMGMSDDFESAILEGATIIRIGSALFGARSAGKKRSDTAS